MTRKNKDTFEKGTCAACSAKDVPLVGVSTKSGGKVCDPCFTTLRQTGIPFDEFDLQADEMTIEMLMDKAGGVTRRTVQNWNKAHKIPFQELRRRVNGTVRKQVVYKTYDVEKFLESENQGHIAPSIEREIIETKEAAALERGFALDVMEKIAGMFNGTPGQQTARVFDCPPLKRLSVKEAASLSGLAESQLAAAIREADNKGMIQHFTGPRGISVYRADQIEFIIENMPPTPKRLPPARKGAKGLSIVEPVMHYLWGAHDQVERFCPTCNENVPTRCKVFNGDDTASVVCWSCETEIEKLSVTEAKDKFSKSSKVILSRSTEV